MAGGEQAGQQGGFLGPSPTGVPGGSVVNSVTSPDNVVEVVPTSGAVVVTQNIVATWGTLGSVRYFAVDSAAGNDANAGFSDVSQAAAGLVAKKTIRAVLDIIPKFGNGRSYRLAIKAGNYAASDATLNLFFSGYTRQLICGTDTVASAGAVAFAGDTNDTICSGMTTATGMNAAGYNPTAYAVDAEGTPTITLQLAGGGAPGFLAAPARPYLCRLRFDVATTTVALRNFADSIQLVPTGGGGAQLILANPLPANPVITDVCYIEMPNVTGITTLAIGGAASGASQAALSGISATLIEVAFSSLKVAGCEGTLLCVESNVNVLKTTVNPTGGTAINVGIGIRSGGTQLTGGVAFMTEWGDTGSVESTIFKEVEIAQLERFSAPGIVLYGGAHATGNNIQETVGTNSSTAHGATCQIWAPQTATPGVAACGLANYGGYQLGRIKFSNMGAHPCVCVGGVGFGVCLQAISGGAADGNNDVGLDLSPAGIVGNTLGADGCAFVISTGTVATGVVGDVRLPNGTITTWAALLATGLTDTAGNRFVSPVAPVSVVATLSGVLVTNAGTPSTTDLGNPGFQPLLNANSTPGVEYPTSLRFITRMRVAAPAGNGATPVVVTLARRTGGVRTDTTMTATIPGGAGAWSVVSDLAHPQLFLDGDLFAVHADSIATGEGNKPITVTLEGP